jgi:hypothetical protein
MQTWSAYQQHGDPNLRIIPRGTQTKTAAAEAASAADEVAAERGLILAWFSATWHCERSPELALNEAEWESPIGNHDAACSNNSKGRIAKHRAR